MTRPTHLVIVFDPKEKEPPSKLETLLYILKVAQKHGVVASLSTIDKVNFRLADVIFVRQNTFTPQINEFIIKAENLGIPIIDDSKSIILCCNKIEISARFANRGVPTPITGVLEPDWDMENAAKQLGYPFLIKDPCPPHEIILVRNKEEIPVATKQMWLQTRGPILVQEFIPNNFFWGIGILNGEVLYCCQYKMPRNQGHVTKRFEAGNSITLKPENYPREICQIAIHAASCIGRGLYRVSIKESHKGPVVAEINVNPSIDRGYEDKYDVWPRIIEHFKVLDYGNKTRQAKNIDRQIVKFWGNYLNTCDRQ